MFDDDDESSPFRPKRRNASRRATLSRHVSHADIDLETAAGPLRLYVTASILVEIDLDACLPDVIFGTAAPSSVARLPKRTKR
jgi:hypothetical protein